MPPDRHIEVTPPSQTRRQPAERGMSLDTIKQQLTTFQRGIPFAELKKPCTLNDGIQRISASELPDLSRIFEKARAAGRVTKFVPASGAATRMFLSLLASHQQSPATAPPSARDALEHFLSNLPKLACYHDLRDALTRQGHDLDQLISERNSHPVLRTLLNTPGLNYAKLPKGLLPFHRYATTTRTPIQEQMFEAVVYAKDAEGHIRFSLTCSAAHREAMQRHIERAKRLFDRTLTWMVHCSVQRASTDTMTVDLNNRPVRDAQGNLLFRPGGHGALLSNLNELHGDVLFIKNIDNVLHDHLKDDVYTYKRALGGLLISLQDTLFAYLHELDAKSVSSARLKEMTEWASDALTTPIPARWTSLTRSEKTQWLFTALHRPLRVCGMVPNTGEPGGGPFWVDDEDGTSSLQIVEASQVDPDSPTQQNIFKSSTHFNPVDLVCGVRDYTGRPFDLHRFVNPHTGFISRKFHDGREVKILERPGLWNGAMAHWHTVFVEVPRSTFSPVKTILDLLLPAHQPPNG